MSLREDSHPPPQSLYIHVLTHTNIVLLKYKINQVPWFSIYLFLLLSLGVSEKCIQAEWIAYVRLLVDIKVK